MEEREPNWNAKEMNRKSGSTTFKTCGWCIHTSGGSCRFNCYITSHCGLLPDWNKKDEHAWDTECVILKMGKADMDSLIGYVKGDIKDSEDNIKRYKERLKALAEIKLKLPNKPCDLEHRKHNCFNIGDTIWVFINGENWVKGEVVIGYRHHDGCVSFVLDEMPETNKGWGCGTQVPSILSDNEKKYFEKNKEDFQLWLNNARKEKAYMKEDPWKYIKMYDMFVKQYCNKK